jgi:hypothetical protein
MTLIRRDNEFVECDICRIDFNPSHAVRVTWANGKEWECCDSDCVVRGIKLMMNVTMATTSDQLEYDNNRT